MLFSDYFLIGPNSKYFSFENFFISISTCLANGILPNFIEDKICLQFENLFLYFSKIFKFLTVIQSHSD